MKGIVYQCLQSRCFSRRKFFIDHCKGICPVPARIWCRSQTAAGKRGMIKTRFSRKLHRKILIKRNRMRARQITRYGRDDNYHADDDQENLSEREDSITHDFTPSSPVNDAEKRRIARFQIVCPVVLTRGSINAMGGFIVRIIVKYCEMLSDGKKNLRASGRGRRRVPTQLIEYGYGHPSVQTVREQPRAWSQPGKTSRRSNETERNWRTPASGRSAGSSRFHHKKMSPKIFGKIPSLHPLPDIRKPLERGEMPEYPEEQQQPAKPSQTVKAHREEDIDDTDNHD